MEVEIPMSNVQFKMTIALRHICIQNANKIVAEMILFDVAMRDGYVEKNASRNIAILRRNTCCA